MTAGGPETYGWPLDSVDDRGWTDVAFDLADAPTIARIPQIAVPAVPASRVAVRAGSWMAVAALVLVSSIVRFHAASGLRAPWIAPDEMVYALTGRSFWETGHLELLGTAAPFYGFYPLLVGLPFWLFDTATGLVLVQAAQAVLMSLTAAIVFVWARPFVRERWAFVAAVMMLTSPALVRSGEVMTEAAFLPLMTLALWLLTRALVRPAWRNQIAVGMALTAALAVRFQGIAFVLVICLSVVLMGLLDGDAPPVRRFWPMALSVLSGLALLRMARMGVGGGSGALGAYSQTVLGGYDPVSVVRWTGHEVGDLFLLVLGIPLVAAASLLATHVRHRRRSDRGVAALLAVTLAYCAVTVVQVGAFASQYTHQLAERDLITAVPPLLVACVVWLAGGQDRAQPWTSIAAFAVAAPAVLLPVRSLVTPGAIPDGFSLAPLLDFADSTSIHALAIAWPVAAAACVLVVVLAPRRAAPVLAIAVIGGLATSSILAHRMVVDRTASDRAEFFGGPIPNWIDTAAAGRVLYLGDGDPLWNGLWQQAFWNDTVDQAATLTVNPVAPTFGVAHARARPDGRVHVSGGSALHAAYVVAPNRLTLVGRRVRSVLQGPNEPGLTLWKIRGVPTLSTRVVGVLPKNPVVPSIPNPIEVTVFDCNAGDLALTVFARQGVLGLTQGTPALRLSVDGLTPTDIVVNPGYAWHVRVKAPPGGARPRRCVFRIAGNGQIGYSRLRFERDPATTALPAAFSIAAPGQTEVSGVRGHALTPVPRIRFCIHGRLTAIDARRVAHSSSLQRAALAIMVAGGGLTCSKPPAGYAQQGFAPPTRGIPAGVYAYYARAV